MRETDKNEQVEWMPHEGGPMPARADNLVEVTYRNGVISEPVPAKQRRWEAWPQDVGETDWDIIAWRGASGDLPRS